MAIRPVDFTVEGCGAFPVDMLRYDGCFPVDTADANAMVDEVGRRKIKLRSYQFHAGVPTVARWESFNWRVI